MSPRRTPDRSRPSRRTRLVRARMATCAALVALLGVATLGLAACSGSSSGGGASTSATSAAPAGGIVREALGSTRPATAPGEELGLWHYTIPAGSKLVPHHHPGWQVARITAGTLTYTILAGTVDVLRGSGAAETHGAGETITLAAGDTVVENPATDHFGANEGSIPVEIYSSTLFTEGEPPAIPLPSPSPS